MLRKLQNNRATIAILLSFCCHKTMLNRCIVGEIINSQNKNLKSKMASNPKGGKKNFLIEFTNVTNEERNNIVRFIKDPSDPDLADSSNNFHCVVLIHPKHEGKIKTLVLRKKCIYITNFFFFILFLRLMFNSSKR